MSSRLALPFAIAYAGTINLRHPINKHGQDSGDLTNKLTKRPSSSHLRSTYSFAYLNTISMHAKQENPKLINPPALSPAYSFRQNFIFHIFFSSFSMKPNDGSLLLSHCLNSHRDYHSFFFLFGYSLRFINLQHPCKTSNNMTQHFSYKMQAYL